MTPDLWPHQERAIAEFFSAVVKRSARRICIASPTGGGKSRILAEIARKYIDIGKPVVWYTNRKMLLEQTAGVLDRLGLTIGKRAAGHFPEHHHLFQVASVQTEARRSLKDKTWELHNASLAIFDEAHLMANDTSAKLMAHHLDGGGVVLGATATPINIGQFYDELILAGVNSELRECRSLVRAIHYGPEEPDLRHIGVVRPGEDLSENQQRKAMGSVDDDGRPNERITALFGSVFEWFGKLNPDHRPTILFAPGVKESLWFAQEFVKRGVNAAHIDGQEVWVDGELHRSSREIRQQVIDGSRSGEIKVVTNRFVMREGIDAPWLAHGIFATVFGSLQTYLQSGGRVIRAYPGIESVVIQDHGGNWHRHGSLNADRHWQLDESDTKIASQREDRMREGLDKQPIRCPQCAMILMSLRCPCGYTVKPTAKTRPVVMQNGQIVEIKGDVYPPRRRMTKPDTAEIWQKTWFRAFNTGMTFKQAEGLFVHENKYYPPRDTPLMPKTNDDMFRRVNQCPLENLQGPLPDWLDSWVQKRKKSS